MNMGNYEADIINQDSNVVYLALVASLSLLFLVFLNATGLRMSMDIMIDLICVIPSSAMYKIKMTNYMRR